MIETTHPRTVAPDSRATNRTSCQGCGQRLFTVTDNTRTARVSFLNVAGRLLCLPCANRRGCADCHTPLTLADGDDRCEQCTRKRIAEIIRPGQPVT